MLRFFIIVLLVSTFTSCVEKRTEDPINAYKFWAGEKPPKEIEVINGKYWESPHFTKEYIMYLELNPSDEWKTEFIKQNDLVQPKIAPKDPPDAPSWFKPTKNCKLWVPTGYSQGSVYYEDTLTGHLFIYEIQL
jgi:hypothetical protein